MFVVWSTQLHGTFERVPAGAALLPDRRARHYWDPDRGVGRAYQALDLDGETLELSQEAWDLWLLFGPDVRWPAGEAPPRPDWWEHQLRGMPNERRLDAERFTAKATELGGTP